MAEELNMHFSSVFTREDTSSIPVPETKFKGSEGERLGQLVCAYCSWSCCILCARTQLYVLYYVYTATAIYYIVH